MTTVIASSIGLPGAELSNLNRESDMNISASASSFSSQASATSRPAQGPPPKKQEALAAALTAVGVDDSTASSVLSQVEEAVEEVKSSSASGSTSETAIRSAIDGVLEANGIDSEKVGEAIQGNRPPGPPRGGGRKAAEEDSSTVESALLAADVDETDVDELLNQLIETLTEQQESQSGNVSSESVRAAWTQVLEDNGVNVEKFEQALGKQLGSTGNFFNRVA
ncbi:hypothetical protein [Novipirellula caenicola]|uniref:Secreted protein n=1 Tax=Novipirellula caenicola TaxID=1536901 RepID=A0ABP9VX87_9BACT